MIRAKIKKIFKDARNEKRAIPAFNFNNLECLKAIVESAEETQYPVIAQVTESAAKYMGYDFVAAIGQVVRKSKYVYLHWDHGFDYALAQKNVKSKNYDSVMHDSSLLDWKSNIDHTKKMMQLGITHDVWIEGEIGKIGGKEDDHEGQASPLTTVEEAVEFNKQCKVDMLAIAAGTAHGYYEGEVKIDFQLIQNVAKALPNTFLVLHGGSGVPHPLITQAINSGIVKLNIGTEVANAYYEGLMEWFKKNPGNFDSRKFNRYAIDNTKKLIKNKIKLCQN